MTQPVMSGDRLTVAQAQEGFLGIMRQLNGPDQQELLAWIKSSWQDAVTGCDDAEDCEELLDAIVADLRIALPLDAVLPSETIRIPDTGKNADCTPQHMLHVDAFLYNDDLVDTLCEEGQLARSYCLQCGSRNTRPLTYISHSMSRERLAFVFKAMLPPLDGKVVLDIGSRLGAALYGAYVYSKAAVIVGVEMNGDLCKIQNSIVSKYKLQDKVRVVHADVMCRPDLVAEADVIIMNNVFEFFLSTEQQSAVWKFLRHTMRPGTLLVTVPPLAETLPTLQMDADLDQWVEALPLYNPVEAGVILSAEEMLELGHYRIISAK
ncbi:uncharacterized protein [Periplaneta americana]|uniref:uncharacterized protein n=1 Tax=Periplaneta americana TaxID=6978 RepID=UPI0037E755AD